MLRRLYHLTFQQACSTPIPDLIHYLLQLPCPASTGTKVRAATRLPYQRAQLLHRLQPRQLAASK